MMSLSNRAIEAYRDSQVQDRKFKEEQASQFCDRAKRWLDKTFGAPASVLDSLAPDTKIQSIGWLNDIKCRVRADYKELRLDIAANCPECGKLLWLGGCTNLVSLGRTLVNASENVNLVKECRCQYKQQRELTAQERFAQAFTDIVLEVTNDR